MTTPDLFGNSTTSQLAAEQAAANKLRREMRALFKLAGVRPLTSELVLRGLELINATERSEQVLRMLELMDDEIPF
jgi:hypothetical protein